MEFLMFLCPRVVVFGASLKISHSHFYPSLAGATSPSVISVSICGCGKNGHHPSQGRHDISLGRARPQVFVLTRKDCVGDVLRCCLGKVHLPCWCFIVARHGGNVQRSVCCLLLLGWISSDIYHSSSNTVLKVSPVGIQFTYSTLRDIFFFPGVSSVGVVPLPLFSCKLLDETVTTFAFFPRGFSFSVATTLECCPCHLVRVTSTLAVGRVETISRR